MFSCEVCVIFKNIFKKEHFRWLLLFTAGLVYLEIFDILPLRNNYL